MKTAVAMIAAAGLGWACIAGSAAAQPVLFDFENAPVHTSLPIDLTVGGVTAHLSASGQGMSIQPANTYGFTPPGFAGLCIWPNSVFASDLLVSFSRTVTDFSILYSPQELGCDDSARMRVTATMNGVVIGTNTATAAFPGTWPSETLSIHLPQGFNGVMVHYDARPPTCQDYGVIFMADNMSVTAVACRADFNGNGLVTVQDLFDFLSAWFGGAASADFNGSGSVSVQDLFDFLGAWFTGCA